MNKKNKIVCGVIIVTAIVVSLVIGWAIGHFGTAKCDSCEGPSVVVPAKYNPDGGPYSSAAVATDAPECSQVGTSILSKNGSAVDAAIAAMFCIGIINLHSVGVGGGGVMLVYNRKNRAAQVFDYRETAPANATEDMFVGKGNQSKRGGLSIAVPGEVSGHYQAWRKHGWLPWKQLVQPAIDLAKNGFTINQPLYEVMIKSEADIRSDPGLSELLLDENNNLWSKGDVITNLKLAATLETIRDHPESFYEGPLADDIARDMKVAKAIVTLDDLKNYKEVTREALQSELDKMTMYLSPPPTSGSVLNLILSILKGYNMTSSDRATVKDSILTYHRIVEAFKFAYAWRSRLGDPAFDPNITKVVEDMMNPETGEYLRRKIWDNATHSNVTYYADFYSDADHGTSHLTVLAPNGDAVSVTCTINYWFGSKYRSTSTGIIYNNEMADFDNPDDEKVDGISPSPFNYPAPRKRPFSSISPAILTDENGDVRLVVGASGGKKITTAVSLVLMNKLWFDETLSKSVDEPRLHNQLVPNQDVILENQTDYRLSEEIVDGLKARGHQIQYATTYAVVQGIYRAAPRRIYAKSARGILVHKVVNTRCDCMPELCTSLIPCFLLGMSLMYYSQNTQRVPLIIRE